MKQLKIIRDKIARGYKKALLFKYYSKKLSFTNQNKKQKIIVCFDGAVPHGGLVDRLKGIVSFYEISKILDFEFSLYFNHPFELTNFLNPNSIDWSINEKDIKYNPFSSEILYLINDFKNPLELIKKSKAKTIFIYANVDYLSVLYPNKSEQELNQIWRNNYFELFKVSNYLEEKIAKYPSESRIVFHTRFTTLMGDFLDTTKSVLKDKEKQDLIRKIINSIDETVILYSNRNIYVLSDSEFFLKEIEKNTNYKVLEGTPKHLENNVQDVDFHLKTFLDFYFIIQSEMVFLLKIDNMYNSSFSKYASIVGNKEFKIKK